MLRHPKQGGTTPAAAPLRARRKERVGGERDRGLRLGWGAVRQRLGDRDGGREANVLLGKTKKRQACRRLGDGDGSPEANILREAKGRRVQAERQQGGD